MPMIQIHDGQIIIVTTPENIKTYRVIRRFFHNNDERNLLPLISSLLEQGYIEEINYVVWTIRE